MRADGVIARGVGHWVHRGQARAFRAWLQHALDMCIYTNVAEMHFSHVLVTPAAEPGSPLKSRTPEFAIDLFEVPTYLESPFPRPREASMRR